MPPLLCPSINDARRLLALFAEAGYTETTIRKHLGSAELPSRNLRNEARLLDRTRDSTTLNMLLRWFWLGNPADEDRAREIVPREFLDLLLASNLLRNDDGVLTTEVMLLPVDNFLVASDHPSSFERSEGELVLWPNPTSRFLGRFAIKKQSRATLDLGTGCGIISLWASAFSDVVVATDLNPRAEAFIRFNARLNGIENIEVHTGESFKPVAGRAFDLILCNPPFFITPRSEYLFCDNPLELDFLCRDLARNASDYLNEGGYLEMLCEWAQVTGQPWEDRVAEWLQGTGCDAWVMKGMTQAPEEYAQQRIRETSKDLSVDSQTYDGYMDYYRSRKVEAIHDGLVVMRKRAGDNWMRIEEVPKTPTGNLGELVLATFAAHDFLRDVEGDDCLLQMRLKLAPHVRLEQLCVQAEGQWRAQSLTLRLINGFPYSMNVQPFVAEFLVGCDGDHTVDQVVDSFANIAKVPRETLEPECLTMLRKLIDRGFIVPSAST